MSLLYSADSALVHFNIATTFYFPIHFRLDTDESGDLDLDEVIAMKETWAREENKRAMVSKVEVDAMKTGWAEKEDRILGLYYA